MFIIIIVFKIYKTVVSTAGDQNDCLGGIDASNKNEG